MRTRVRVLRWGDAMSRAWQEMTHEQLTEELEAGREEAQRRMQQMAALLGMAPAQGKRGRPPASASAFRFGGADQEETEDAASDAAQ
jgi:hypothetical protein